MENSDFNFEGSSLVRTDNDECHAFCPECGSDVFFSKEGCFCKKSFDKKSSCEWSCLNCSPRKCVSK